MPGGTFAKLTPTSRGGGAMGSISELFQLTEFCCNVMTGGCASGSTVYVTDIVCGLPEIWVTQGDSRQARTVMESVYVPTPRMVGSLNVIDSVSVFGPVCTTLGARMPLLLYAPPTYTLCAPKFASVTPTVRTGAAA